MPCQGHVHIPTAGLWGVNYVKSNVHNNVCSILWIQNAIMHAQLAIMHNMHV